MDSTIRSNLTVGMPLDLAVMREGSLTFEKLQRIEADDPNFFAFSDAWSNALFRAFSEIRQLQVV